MATFDWNVIMSSADHLLSTPTGNGTVVVGNSSPSASGSIYQGSYTTSYPYYSTTTQSIGTWPSVTGFTTTPTPGIGTRPVTPEQLKQLMAAHKFIEMHEGSTHCLFCYAVGFSRTRVDHIFVIREE